MASKAELINWRKIVGNDATLDDTMEGEDLEEGILTDENQTVNKIRPVAGPWATVANGLM